MRLRRLPLDIRGVFDPVPSTQRCSSHDQAKRKCNNMTGWLFCTLLPDLKVFEFHFLNTIYEFRVKILDY